MEKEGQVAAGKIALRVAERLPGSSIPKHDRPAAVLLVRDGPLK